MTLIEANRKVENFLKVVPTDAKGKWEKQFHVEPIWAHQHTNPQYVPPTRKEAWTEFGGSLKGRNITQLWRKIKAATEKKWVWQTIIEPKFQSIREVGKASSVKRTTVRT